jgi:hypothetical protein
MVSVEYYCSDNIYKLTILCCILPRKSRVGGPRTTLVFARKSERRAKRKRDRGKDFDSDHVSGCEVHGGRGQA